MKLNKDIMRQAYVAKSAPSSHEIGWLGHKRFKGDKHSVQIKFDPADPKIRDNFTYHTHPSDNPSPLTALPSEQDLIASIMGIESGLRGITIFSGKFYTVVVPTKKANGGPYPRYVRAIKRGDVEDAVKTLEQYGFDIETGMLR